MAKGKDPAFLFYPGDASEDTQFMNRLERGCYFDLLKAQKKFRKFNLALIQKVLGNDFQQCWPAIESVLIKDGELYFIGWVNDAIENRAEHAAKQKKRIDEYWARKRSEENPDSNQNDSTELPKHNRGITLESENEIGDANESENELNNKKESIKHFDSALEAISETLADVEYWTDQVIRGNDETFMILARNNGLNVDDDLEKLARDHLSLCSRYKWHEKIDTQQAFRHSLVGHMKKELTEVKAGKQPKKKFTIEDLNS